MYGNYIKKEESNFPPKNLILSAKDLEGIRKSGKVNTAVLDYISDKLRPGMSTEEIDTLVYNETLKLGGLPATLNYNGYKKSLCTSVNDEVCHGIPSAEVILKEGDIINIDVSTLYDGYYSDAARVFAIGNVTKEAYDLVKVAKASIDVGLNQVKPWTSMKHLGRAIHDFAKSNGYSVAPCIGGHGIGLKFHEEPFVSYDAQGTDILLVPGMVFTIEPAINMGTKHVYEDAGNGWTIFTQDGSLSAQWEVTVAVTESGYEILSY